MRTAEEILNKYDDSAAVFWKDAIAAINEARKEAISECCNVAKTYQVGNSGSWKDAAVDKTPMINLIKELK